MHRVEMKGRHRRGEIVDKRHLRFCDTSFDALSLRWSGTARRAVPRR